MKKAFSKKNLWETLPPFIKNLVGHCFRVVPIEYLFGKTFQNTLAHIKATEFASKEQLEQYQTAKIKQTLENAYQNSLYYRDLFDQHAVSPAHFKTLPDLNKFPLIDKKIVNDQCERMLVVDKSSAGIDYVTTGGTSGVPLSFYINSSRSGIEYAYLVSGWQRVGYTLQSLKAVLRGRVLKKRQQMHYAYDPLLREHYYSSFHMADADLQSYLHHISGLGVCFLHAYPSSVQMLARYIKSQNLAAPDNIIAILAESENVYPEQRRFAEKTLGCRYFSAYGHTEKLVAAVECEHSDNYHVWPTYGYMELLDDKGRSITKTGQTGEITGTGFINSAMPFIRYKTGDFAEFVGESCEQCGRNHMLIRNIRGHRIQENLVANDGSLIPWSAVNMHDDTYDNVRQYQFFQEEKGVAIVKVVVVDQFTEYDKIRIVRNMNLKLAGRVIVSVEIVKQIELTERGKSVFVDQRISF